MKKHVFAGLSLILVLTSGCSVTAPTKQVIAVNFEPKDAVVIAGGLVYDSNNGSIFAEVPCSEDLLIEIRRKGYRPIKHVIPTTLSTTGKIDAWTSILVLPFIGLLTPGAWRLSETNLTFNMEPEQAQPAAQSENAQTANVAKK